MKKYLLLLVIFFGINLCTYAEEPVKKFVLENTRIIPMKSKAGRDYELVVILPSSFYTSPEKKYPVLYFVDAYWDTPMLAATYGNLIYDNLVPEFMMVGLSYPAGADYGKERLLDLSFTERESDKGKTGGAATFLEFIQHQVAPFIETKYRGLPTDRVLSGNSMGGLFALSSAYTSNNFFSGYIAVSPAVEWDNQALATLDTTYALNHKSLPARIFISYGSTEYGLFRDPIIQFQKQLAARKYQGLDLLNYAMEGLDHTSVKGEGYTRGLIWFWKPKKPAGPSGLERGYTGEK